LLIDSSRRRSFGWCGWGVVSKCNRYYVGCRMVNQSRGKYRERRLAFQISPLIICPPPIFEPVPKLRTIPSGRESRHPPNRGAIFHWMNRTGNLQAIRANTCDALLPFANYRTKSHNTCSKTGRAFSTSAHMRAQKDEYGTSRLGNLEDAFRGPAPTRHRN